MSGSTTHDNAGAYAGWSALDALEDVIMDYRAGHKQGNSVMIISLENIDGVVGVSASVAGMNAPEALLCLLYTSPSPRDGLLSRMPSSA